jgi:hypothetical protein
MEVVGSVPVVSKKKIFPRSSANANEWGPGLPDGIFSYQKSLFGYVLEWKMLVYFTTFLFCDYFTAIWYIVWPFGNFVVIRYILPRFGT